MPNKKEMPGYMTYREAALMFTFMPDEEAAKAIKATTNYFLYGTVEELAGITAQVFEIMKSSIDRGRESYDIRIENASKGGKAAQGKRKVQNQG